MRIALVQIHMWCLHRNKRFNFISSNDIEQFTGAVFEVVTVELLALVCALAASKPLISEHLILPELCLLLSVITSTHSWFHHLCLCWLRGALSFYVEICLCWMCHREEEGVCLCWVKAVMLEAVTGFLAAEG